MNCEILCVGSELLNGRKSDLHTAYLGRELGALGLAPRFAGLVPDGAAELEESLLIALRRSQLTFVCGGLGPTLDDITRDVAAKVAGCPLAEDVELARHLKELFASRGREMPLNNLRQAQVPAGARVLANPAGTAPGLVIEARGEFAGRRLILLPGPPNELKAVFEGSALPWLRETYHAPALHARSVMCWGLAESAVDELVSDLVPAGDTQTLSMLAHGTHVEVRLTSLDPAVVASLEAKVLERLGDHAFSSEGKSLEAVVAELLSQSGAKVAVAESCTGGRLASLLTAVPGSSKFFDRGFITYSDASKTDLLEVPPFVIKKAGAVSKDTALAMAVGLARKTGCDYCLSITGIAGPDGGTDEKPVGLVHFALAAPNGISHQVQRFASGGRAQIQARAAQAALFLLYRSLSGLPIDENDSDRKTLKK